MPLKSIQLCHLDPVDRPNNKFEVTCHSDSGNQLVIFSCDSEHDAIKLRNAIRDHASCLRRVADYREDRSVVSGVAMIALKAAHELCTKALPKFNWGASALDAEAISILNTAPGKIAAAIREAK